MSRQMSLTASSLPRRRLLPPSVFMLSVSLPFTLTLPLSRRRIFSTRGPPNGAGRERAKRRVRRTATRARLKAGTRGGSKHRSERVSPTGRRKNYERAKASRCAPKYIFHLVHSFLGESAANVLCFADHVHDGNRVGRGGGGEAVQSMQSSENGG